MRNRRWAAFAMVLGASCQSRDESKDAEIALLKAQLAQTSSSPPLVASAAAPAPTPPTSPISPTPPNIEGYGFTLDIEGQLDRIDAERKSLADKASAERPEEDVKKYADLMGWNPENGDPRTFRHWTRNASTITYAHLKKNSAKYAGKPWFAIDARVLQINERDGVTTARINVGSKRSEEAIYVVARFETDLLEGNKVDIAGYLAGPYSYTSQAQWQITVPALAAAFMVKGGRLYATSKALKADRMKADLLAEKAKKAPSTAGSAGTARVGAAPSKAFPSE
jgi:hypothetical protein